MGRKLESWKGSWRLHATEAEPQHVRVQVLWTCLSWRTSLWFAVDWGFKSQLWRVVSPCACDFLVCFAELINVGHMQWRQRRATDLLVGCNHNLRNTGPKDQSAAAPLP